jgi:hypothetical protein
MKCYEELSHKEKKYPTVKSTLTNMANLALKKDNGFLQMLLLSLDVVEQSEKMFLV